MTEQPQILVVDDVPLFREVEALYLSRIGVVRTAARAADARRILAQERIDVVVLDLHLPDEPGDALCREVLASDGERAPRFVFVTRDDAADYARAIAAGAADVLPKPLARGDLIGAVTRLLGPERIGQPRAVLREPAHFWAQRRVSTGTVQNVSRGGAFVAAGWLPREGADVTVEFALPGETKAIAAPARVVWRRPGAGSAGFGVRFTAIDGRTLRSLAKFVDEHGTPRQPAPRAS